jgi:hypothetical protein
MKNLFVLLLVIISFCFAQKDTLMLVNQGPPYVWVQRDVFSLIEDSLLRDSLIAQNDTIASAYLANGTDTIWTDNWAYYVHPFDTNWSINDTVPAYWDCGYLDIAFLSNPPPQGNFVIDTSAIVIVEFAMEDTVWYRTRLGFETILWFDEPGKPRYLVGIQSEAHHSFTWQEIPYKPYPPLITN